jgi:N-acetylglutamate synthase-like GNAT family acetyltransferase
MEIESDGEHLLQKNKTCKTYGNCIYGLVSHTSCTEKFIEAKELVNASLVLDDLRQMMHSTSREGRDYTGFRTMVLLVPVAEKDTIAKPQGIDYNDVMEQQYLKTLQNGAGTTRGKDFILDEDGEKIRSDQYCVAAAACFAVHDDWYRSSYFEIAAVACDPRIRSKGLGRQIVDAMKRIAMQVNAASILVTAAMHAVGFWERVGFERRPGNKITQVERELTEQKMFRPAATVILRMGVMEEPGLNDLMAEGWMPYGHRFLGQRVTRGAYPGTITRWRPGASSGVGSSSTVWNVVFDDTHEMEMDSGAVDKTLKAMKLTKQKQQLASDSAATDAAARFAPGIKLCPATRHPWAARAKQPGQKGTHNGPHISRRVHWYVAVGGIVTAVKICHPGEGSSSSLPSREGLRGKAAADAAGDDQPFAAYRIQLDNGLEQVVDEAELVTAIQLHEVGWGEERHLTNYISAQAKASEAGELDAKDAAVLAAAVGQDGGGKRKAEDAFGNGVADQKRQRPEANAVHETNGWKINNSSAEAQFDFVGRRVSKEEVVLEFPFYGHKQRHVAPSVEEIEITRAELKVAAQLKKETLDKKAKKKAMTTATKAEEDMRKRRIAIRSRAAAAASAARVQQEKESSEASAAAEAMAGLLGGGVTPAAMATLLSGPSVPALTPAIPALPATLAPDAMMVDTKMDMQHQLLVAAQASGLGLASGPNGTPTTEPQVPQWAANALGTDTPLSGGAAPLPSAPAWAIAAETERSLVSPRSALPDDGLGPQPTMGWRDLVDTSVPAPAPAPAPRSVQSKTDAFLTAPLSLWPKPAHPILPPARTGMRSRTVTIYGTVTAYLPARLVDAPGGGVRMEPPRWQVTWDPTTDFKLHVQTLHQIRQQKEGVVATDSPEEAGRLLHLTKGMLCEVWDLQHLKTHIVGTFVPTRPGYPSWAIIADASRIQSTGETNLVASAAAVGGRGAPELEASPGSDGGDGGSMSGEVGAYSIVGTEEEDPLEHRVLAQHRYAIAFDAAGRSIASGAAEGGVDPHSGWVGLGALKSVRDISTTPAIECKLLPQDMAKVDAATAVAVAMRSAMRFLGRNLRRLKSVGGHVQKYSPEVRAGAASYYPEMWHVLRDDGDEGDMFKETLDAALISDRFRFGPVDISSTTMILQQPAPGMAAVPLPSLQLGNRQLHLKLVQDDWHLAGHEWVGRRIRRDYGDAGQLNSTVVGYIPPSENDGIGLWHAVGVLGLHALFY